MKNFNKLSVFLLLYIVFTILPRLATANDMLAELYFGDSVTFNNSQINIDTKFLDNLVEAPTYANWSKNYWELIYFVLLDHPKAIDIAIDLIGSEEIKGNVAMAENAGTVARPLSRSKIFWSKLEKKTEI